MAIKCTGRRMAGGSEHEHISDIRWQNDQSGDNGVFSTTQMIVFISANGPNSVYCPDQVGGASAWVHVNSNGRIRHIQSSADGRWTNNLLALPLF